MLSSRSHNNPARATASRIRKLSTHRHNCDSSRSKFPEGRGGRGTFTGSGAMRKPYDIDFQPSYPRLHGEQPEFCWRTWYGVGGEVKLGIKEKDSACIRY